MAFIPDPVAIRNERRKLFAGFVNAIGLGLIGFAILKPVVENQALVPDSNSSVLCDSPSLDLAAFLLWGVAGLALHIFSHYILGGLRKEA